MKPDRPCHVETYSGSRADQWPLRFRCDGTLVETSRLERTWRTPDAEYFELRGSDGRLYRLRQERATGLWFVREIG